MPTDPSSSHGGFNGGTITSALDVGPTITTPGTVVPFTVHAENADDAPDVTVYFNDANGLNGAALVQIEARGDGDAQLNLADWNFDGTISLDTAGYSRFLPRSTLTPGTAVLRAGLPNAEVKLMFGGYIVVQQHAAPADAELAAGDLALWFDQTNGAAKAMLKAKQADGTVKTAAIALA